MRHVSAPATAVARTRRLLLVTLVCFLALQALPLFDVARLLPPPLAQRCATTALRTEHGVTESAVGYAGHEQGRLWLYSTTLVRSVRCRGDDDDGGETSEWQYRDVYLNVTHHDVEQELQALRLRHPLDVEYPAWQCRARCHGVHWDRHGLSEQEPPAEQADWATYAFLKACALVLGAAAALGLESLLVLWRCRANQSLSDLDTLEVYRL